NADEIASRQYIDNLVEEQIIIPASGPNITGDDWMAALLQDYQRKGWEDGLMASLDDVLRQINTPDRQPYEMVPVFGNQLLSLFGKSDLIKNPFYVVTERKCVTGGLNKKFQTTILEALRCLDKLVPYVIPDSLDAFKKSFNEKFEGREMPLLYVLDPEVGISYQNLENTAGALSLINNIHFGETSPAPETYMRWTNVHSLLLGKLQATTGHGARGGVIEITDKDLAALNAPMNAYQLPPSLSVMFRIAGEKVIIESAGGVSATSLLGRFSGFSEALFRISREIAEQEQRLNEEVVFAEISHANASHSDNINRRSHLRDFEIPVAVASTMNDTYQIALSDLYVSIVNGQVLLRSKPLGKPVIPRLGTAYNAGNSDLSVFLFLNDLQFQGMKVNFKLELEEFFPGLTFYPRVEYKSSILCLAKWCLSSSDFVFLKSESLTQWLAAFEQLATTLSLPDYFGLSHHDNYLVFNRRQEEDVWLFLESVRNKDKIVLTEFLLDNTGEVMLDKGVAKPVLAQYVAPLVLNEKVYGLSGNIFADNGEGHRNFMPGSEWLYFKIYCHPSWSNELLSGILLPALSASVRKKQIDKWFFVRYNDPDFHIRIRVHAVNGSLGNIIALFSKKCKLLVDEGIVEKYFIDTYVRELERYTPALIGYCETVFYHSSLLVAT
ncbi:MAG: lantibiotic dehydratase, partial [Bacteroidota bacterium]|nr:lantibiotic dehydratase [Bacteroidota bacterium]